MDKFHAPTLSSGIRIFFLTKKIVVVEQIFQHFCTNHNKWKQFCTKNISKFIKDLAEQDGAHEV